jgi:hypothetical protein
VSLQLSTSLAGAIGAFTRLVGVSALAAQYGSAALDQ